MGNNPSDTQNSSLKTSDTTNSSKIQKSYSEMNNYEAWDIINNFAFEGFKKPTGKAQFQELLKMLEERKMMKLEDFGQVILNKFKGSVYKDEEFCMLLPYLMSIPINLDQSTNEHLSPEFPTFLHIAVESYPKSVSLLLDNGANPNAVNAMGVSVLSKAVSFGDVQIVRLLFAHGAKDVHAIHEAAKSKKCTPELIRVLISEKLDPNLHRVEDSATPLLLSAENSPKVISELIESGARVNEKSGTLGETVLIAACSHNNVAGVDVLLRNGADVNLCRDSDGKTALMMTDHPQILTMLIKSGANVNATSKEGRHTLHYLLLRPKQKAHLSEAIQVLRSHGINLMSQDFLGAIPLHYAIVHGLSIVKLCLPADCKPAMNLCAFNFPFKNQKSFFEIKTGKLSFTQTDNPNRFRTKPHRFIDCNEKEVGFEDSKIRYPSVEEFFLSEIPEDLTETISEELTCRLLVFGQSPFHILLSQKCKSFDADPKTFYEFFLSHGADPNQPDLLGRFPVHLASIRCNYPALSILEKYGANPFVTFKGKTPLEFRTDPVMTFFEFGWSPEPYLGAYNQAYSSIQRQWIERVSFQLILFRSIAEPDSVLEEDYFPRDLFFLLLKSLKSLIEPLPEPSISQRRFDY